MEAYKLSLTQIIGYLILTLIVTIQIVQGGKCTGEWQNKHYCFGGNGKRSGSPLADLIYGDYPKRVQESVMPLNLPSQEYEVNDENIDSAAKEPYPDYPRLEYPSNYEERLWRQFIERKRRLENARKLAQAHDILEELRREENP